MIATSSRVRSNQSGIHHRLNEVVSRHLARPWRRLPGPASRSAFRRIADEASGASALVLDSGCGTGASTAAIARLHPDALVIGIDRSARRLERAPLPLPDNARLVRARLEDFWALAAAAGWRPSHHYLLYPNPWPKSGHLMRRWHAHPAFPTLLALGGRFELRSNWELYLLEFEAALARAGVGGVEVVSFPATGALTPFEQKYADSGHDLYCLTASLEEWTCNRFD